MENLVSPHLQTQYEAYLNFSRNIKIDEFRKLYSNYNFILKALWINEKYNMIIDNYYDFQLEVLKAEEELMKIDNQNEIITLGQQYIVNFNRKIANILSSVRMYSDQTKHDLSSSNELSCNYENFKSDLSAQYDSSIGYQIMEFLRNYMQHEGLMIDELRSIKLFFSNNSNNNDYINLIVLLDYKRLKSIKNYTKKIKLDKLLKNTNSEKFNIMWFLEEYINGIIKVHKQLYSRLNPIIDKYIEEIDSILLKYYKNVPQEVGVFSMEEEFLLQYSYIHRYIKDLKEKPKVFKSCYKQRKIFHTNNINVRNGSTTIIKYNMV